MLPVINGKLLYMLWAVKLLQFLRFPQDEKWDSKMVSSLKHIYQPFNQLKDFFEMQHRSTALQGSPCLFMCAYSVSDSAMYKIVSGPARLGEFGKMILISQNILVQLYRENSM